MTAPVTPAAVVQAFVKSRCIPACTPVAQHEVWASIDAWIADQGLPHPEQDEIIRTLHQMGFVDSRDLVRNGAKTDTNWQWRGFQLLPADAPDNEGDPFGSPQV
jgi:hypothetical protein